MAETASATVPATSAQPAAATAGAPNAPADQNATNRGLPYYEKLRRELRDTLAKKRMMDRSMAQLEDQIFRFEQSYLEETTAGNIIKGFDNYIKGSANTSTLGASGLGIGGGARRKAQVTDADRVFSRSSASYMQQDSPGPSSVQTTPSHAATPTSTPGPNGLNRTNGGDVSVSGNAAKNSSGSSKNKKKAGGGSKNTKGKTEELSDDGEKPSVKRLKISYGRD
ncbi:hypothetical protein N7468_009210 [Penicillium chermesinum]|uniref:Chromatin modification-related protein EAF6 n=1 Tax=Penicillium chermesinum TaxID=63820 RepID=A0A9W9NHD5_9EURO|nr:uncharacterized protein N7468_009210 [Penicillium chermesinum]KAJ5220006.1 hypothetical protein N7468_009210 [Penicillium chermesinum]